MPLRTPIPRNRLGCSFVHLVGIQCAAPTLQLVVLYRSPTIMSCLFSLPGMNIDSTVEMTLTSTEIYWKFCTKAGSPWLIGVGPSGWSTTSGGKEIFGGDSLILVLLLSMISILWPCPDCLISQFCRCRAFFFSYSIVQFFCLFLLLRVESDDRHD